MNRKTIIALIVLGILLSGLMSLSGCGKKGDESSDANVSVLPGEGTILMGVELNDFLSDADKAKSLGVNIVRVPLRWGQVEAEKGVYDFSKYDAIVDKAQALDMKIYFTAKALSSWGTVAPPSSNGTYLASSMPVNEEDWTNFLAEFAKRYRDRNIVAGYEIENEVNSPAFWKGTIQDYATHLKASYIAIKSADPDALVLASSLACGITSDASGKDSSAKVQKFESDLGTILDTKTFDVVSVHDYYFPDHEVNGITFQTYLDTIKNAISSRGLTSDIWITEAGYVSVSSKVGSRTDPGSEENQAKWFKAAHAYAQSQGVKVMSWITLNDREEPYFGTMGMLNSDGSRRLVADVFESLAVK
ncbi:MAG: cellulase family glycosylhydrolase [archaeon]